MDLKDLKVLELASVLAGPAVGMFFAEHGAEVIKIENKLTGGDVTRSWKTKFEDPHDQVSAYFSSINYHKKYLRLDLTQEVDLQNCYELIKSSDIVISNFRRDSAAKLKLDYSHIKTINPSIIYGEILGYKNDPRAAYDVVLQAESGFMSINGESTSDPTKVPVAIIDMFAAHQLKQGLLTALLKKTSDGKGSYVSVSLEEAAISALGNQASNYLMTGQIPERNGSLHPNIAPYGEILKSTDGQELVLAIGNNNQFNAFCNLLELHHLPDDPRFNSNNARVANRKILLELLQQGYEKLEFKVVYNECKKMNIPVGKIKKIDEVFHSAVGSQMVLREVIDGVETKRPRSSIFTLQQ